MKTGKRLTIGFSPCPNDTFIFDALVHQRFEQPYSWIYRLKDVETLNRNAETELFDVTKLSFFAYALVSDKYQILSSGSALGRNCGPLLISKQPMKFEDLSDCKIAIPGKHTTANLLLSLFLPDHKNKIEMVFSEIENAVLNNDVDAGLIIHENRFTYQEKGLLKIADMGELWEQTTGLPIPLGCIAVRRDLSKEQKTEIDREIRKSIEFAFSNPKSSVAFIRENASEMSEAVQQQHIKLYVNDFSIDLGKEGQNAIRVLFGKGINAGLFPEITEPVFVNNID